MDELGHLPSGLFYLQSGDPRHASLNPPLVNVLSALPVLFFESVRRAPVPEASDDPFSFWPQGYRFLEAHRDEYRRIYAWARTVPMLGVAAVGGLLYAWGRRLVPEAPEAAGLLAAGFWLLSPNVIAQARLVGTDTGLALFATAAVATFGALLRRPTPAWMLAAGVALGLAQLAKVYALLLYPALLATALAWPWLDARTDPAERWAALRRRLGAWAAASALSLVVLAGGYSGQELGEPLAELPLQSDTLRSWQDSVVGRLPVPLPGAYLRALDGQLVEADSKIPSYLFGERFEGGRWDYYLQVLALKTPLPLALAFVLALVGLARGPRLRAGEAVLLLAFPTLLFVVLSLGGRRQLGARALLAAVPLVQLFVAATIARAWPRRWPLGVATAALLWLAAVSWAVHPHYLAYFNELVGGREAGYRYASDANVDIGQDLVGLADFVDSTEHAGEGPLQLLYFGSVDPALYGIDYEVPGPALRPGWLAVSVSLYRMQYPVYDHGELRLVGPIDPSALGEPEASIGGSIHLYRVGGRREDPR